MINDFKNDDSDRKAISYIESMLINHPPKTDCAYTLYTHRNVMEDDIDKKSGICTGHMTFKVDSDSLKVLEDFYKYSIANYMDSSAWHFIADNKNRKVIKLIGYTL